MPTLLLITTEFPHKPEFLDREIMYLADVFDEIHIAPMRPTGQCTIDLPKNVYVDYSLARQLQPKLPLLGEYSRQIFAIIRFFLARNIGTGLSRDELLRSLFNRSMYRLIVLGRSDTWAILQWAKSRKSPNLVYSFWLGSATLGLGKAWPDCFVITRAHGGDVYPEQHKLCFLPFQKAAIGVSNVIAAVSDAGANYLRAKHPADSKKIVTRRLGTPDFAGISVGKPGRILKILSVSSIVPLKRVPLIAKVLSIFAKEQMHVHWTHLGDGPEMSLVMNELEFKPSSLTVHLPGQVSLDDVHEEMRNGQYHAFINLSISEGAPFSLMEAQSVGLPTLATVAGGIPEVVPSTLNELIDIHLEVDSIVEALKRLVARDHCEAQMRRTYWQQHYCAEANYSKWAEELKNYL